ITLQNATAGYFTATSTAQASTFPYASTTALTVSGSAYVGSFNGPLQANNGLVSATTSIGYQYGGTGLTVAPSFGQILRGTGSGYALVATSSLGINTIDITEGSNLFWTNDRFDNRLSATTTLPNITTLANIATVGIITSGTWSGSTIAVNKGGTGQTSFGQGWLNSDGTALSASTSPTVNYITATSTTATSTFAGGLTVAGHCVTGDTRLRRRRKKKNGEGYDYDDVMIKDIQSGDEIASLDEKTGKIVWSKVNALMDMGVKKIYKLTTASGKVIRTTAEHPYLIKKKETPSARAIAFIDYANIKAWIRGKNLSVDLKALYSALKDAGVSDVRFYYGTDAKNDKIGSFFRKLSSFGYSVTTKPVQYFKIALLELLNQQSNKRWLETMDAPLKTNLLDEAVRLDEQGIEFFVPKANFDVEITADSLKVTKNYDQIILFSGDGDFAYLLKTLKKLGKRSVVVSGRKSLSGSLIKEADKFVTLERFGEKIPGLFAEKQNPPHGRVLKKCAFNIADLLGLSNYCPVDNSVSIKEGSWTKVVYLKEGMEIAVSDKGGNEAVWDKISKIEVLPEEQVYDMEVDGTHNFIGNDIVAHNTYIGGSASAANLIVSNSSVLGTVSSGLWNASAIGTQYGGTGQNFSASSGLMNLYSGTA
ncbi:MAG: NYN domain-containing protein, partial [Patescibacteria group bacterium]